MAREEELEYTLKDILRRVVEGILYWDHDKCPVCTVHAGSHAKECALVEAAKVLEIDLDAT